jgi:hypothetical protein
MYHSALERKSYRDVGEDGEASIEFFTALAERGEYMHHGTALYRTLAQQDEDQSIVMDVS